MLKNYLLENGIGSTVHYPAPDYEFSAPDLDRDHVLILPDTEKACAEVLSLPCYPELNPWEVERICDLITKKLAEMDR